MHKSIIGANVALRYLKAYQAHVDYWKEVNPVTALAYVDKPEHAVYIEQYAETFPSTLIVARIKHDLDGGFHLKPTGAGDNRYYVSSPVDYHNAYGHLGRLKNVILHVLNEPNGFGSDDDMNRLERWVAEYMNVAIREKTKSVLFNWADRNPQIIGGMFDPRFDDILKKMAQYPDLFYMGLHMYGPDEIVSHIESYVTRCERLGIVPPKVIVTEFGLDKHDGSKENGYKSWGWGGGKFALWQIMQVQNELAPYIKRGVIVGFNVFQEGNSGGWENFDYENDHAYKTEIKRAALAGELEVVTTKINTVPAPANKGEAITVVITGTSKWNLRTEPDLLKGVQVGQVKPGDTLKLYMSTIQPNGGYNWYFVEREDAPAGESKQGWMVYTLPVTTPPPVIEPPVVTPTLPPPFLEVSAEKALSMSKLYTSLADTYAAMVDDHRKLAAEWLEVYEQTRLDKAA